MRLRIAVGLVGLVGLALPGSPAWAVAQSPERINPMIALHEQGLPVFGISHPGITGGRGGGEPPPLSEVVRETVAYRLGDYMYTGGVSDRFLEYVTGLRESGASARTHPFIAKALILHRNPEAATGRILRQLDAGHVGAMIEQVESAEEIRQAVATMRFRSQGGLRPDEGIEFAAAYWGLSEQEYRRKADVWPINPDGELILWAIVESRDGVANVREIAAEPGVGVLWAGWGTLGQVYSGDPEGRQAAADRILAACKEFDVPCGFPANNPADIERLMAQGWSVFVMQSWGETGRSAVEAGRRLSGRPTSAGP